MCLDLEQVADRAIADTATGGRHPREHLRQEHRGGEEQSVRERAPEGQLGGVDVDASSDSAGGPPSVDGGDREEHRGRPRGCADEETAETL